MASEYSYDDYLEAQREEEDRHWQMVAHEAEWKDRDPTLWRQNVLRYSSSTWDHVIYLYTDEEPF